MLSRTLSTLATAILILALPLPAAASGSTGEVCTIGGVAVPLGEPIPGDIPLVMSCFDSSAEAEAFIEAGAPGDLEQLAPGVQGRSALAASTVTIGRVWTGSSRGGSELIHWGTGTGCYGTTYGFPTLSAGWNDNVRSAQGYSNCWSSQYTNASYGGSVITCAPYCSSLGATSSSIVYRPVGTFG